METLGKMISEEEKKQYIEALTSELPMLRAKAVVSQDELASFVGISRQTFGAIERRERPMGWNTYLSLIFYFDNNRITRRIVRSLEAFPHDYIENLSGGSEAPDRILSALSAEYSDIFDKLDEQAIHSIRTLIMIEYARCTNRPGESIVKSFDGMNFMAPPPDPRTSRAIRKLKKKG